jgi:hypothetical protein
MSYRGWTIFPSKSSPLPQQRPTATDKEGCSTVPQGAFEGTTEVSYLKLKLVRQNGAE